MGLLQARYNLFTEMKTDKERISDLEKANKIHLELIEVLVKDQKTLQFNQLQVAQYLATVGFKIERVN